MSNPTRQYDDADRTFLVTFAPGLGKAPTEYAGKLKIQDGGAAVIHRFDGTSSVVIFSAPPESLVCVEMVE